MVKNLLEICFYCRGFWTASKHLQLQEIGVMQIILITSNVFKSLSNVQALLNIRMVHAFWSLE